MQEDGGRRTLKMQPGACWQSNAATVGRHGAGDILVEVELLVRAASALSPTAKRERARGGEMGERERERRWRRERHTPDASSSRSHVCTRKGRAWAAMRGVHVCSSPPVLSTGWHIGEWWPHAGMGYGRDR